MIGTGICFDLGTDYTSVLVNGKGVIACEPSVAAVDLETGKISSIGSKAYEMIGRTPDLTQIVHPIKEGSVFDFQTMQNIMAHYIQKVCANKVLKPTILMCIPGSANTIDKHTVLDLATSAGAARACLIEQPLAAAIGAGFDVNSYSGKMIVDIGAGTTDIAVIARGMICTSKTLKIAGNSFDEAIIAFLKKEKSLSVGKITAERIKKDVGCTSFLEAELAVRAVGKDTATNLPKSIEVTSEDIFVAIREQLEAIYEGIRSVLEQTPPELNADVSKNGIVISGGSAMLTGIDKFLEYRTGIHSQVAEKPYSCVIRGMGKAIKATALLERNGCYFKTRQELVGYEE